MTFNKSILAAAVAVAISAPTFAQVNPNAGDITLEGTGSIIVGAGTPQDITKIIRFEDIDESGNPESYIRTEELLKNQRATGQTDGLKAFEALYYKKGGSLLELTDANLSVMDFDLRDANTGSHRDEEFLTEGESSTFVFNKVKADSAFIETNGAHIGHDGNAAAIEIKDSTLTGVEFDIKPGDIPIPEAFKGHKELLVNNGGKIVTDNSDFGDDSPYVGAGNAIDISGSDIDGVIINEDWSQNNNSDIKQGFIASANGAAISVRDSKWKGGVVNSNAKIEGDRAGIELVNTQFEGAIINERGAVIEGTYGIASSTIREGSSYTGDINNTGTISGSTTGISLDNTKFNGEINNSGIISGGTDGAKQNYGIYIGNGVSGNVVINQTAGELTGDTALRMNKNTRANYTGGKITGNVDNQGGTFYVEGNQTIAGDYAQTSGSTLAMGLHKETSLAANNISLGKDSTVLIDLSKGDMYIRNGDSVELLKVTADGKITDEADYAIASKLVSIADIKKEDDKVILTFKRDKFVDSSNANSQRQADNFNNLGAALANISKNLPSDTPVETIRYFNALLAVIEENPAAALPDVTGASKAAAMSASNQSNTQISVRARGLASGDALENTGLWTQGFVSKGQQDNRNDESYNVKSRGFVLGADTELNDGLVVGGAYSFVKNDITTQSSRTDSDYHMATAYAAQAIEQVLLDGQTYYAWGSNDSSRDIGASASYDSHLYGVRLGAGYQFDLDNAARLVPTLSLEASRLSVDGYTEGGFGALKMDKQHYNRLELGLNTELSKDYQLSRALVTPSVSLGAFHDFKADTQNNTVAFAVAPAETFNVEGTKPEKTRYVAGAGVDIVNNANLTVSAEYNYNWNTDGFDANSGALKFRWDF